MEIAETDWPEGWGAMGQEQADFFTAQLARELGPGHPVSRQIAAGTCRAIGKFWGSDDAVYAIEGWQAPFFVAHLAFPAEDRRGWPARKLRPRPASRFIPAMSPLAAIAELARYFD